MLNLGSNVVQRERANALDIDAKLAVLADDRRIVSLEREPQPVGIGRREVGLVKVRHLAGNDLGQTASNIYGLHRGGQGQGERRRDYAGR